MLNSTGKETIIHSSLNHMLKTDSCVHRQRRGHEDSPTDMSSQARNGTDRCASGQVARGERGFRRRHRNRPGDSEIGAVRAILPRVKEEVSCGVKR